MIAPGTVLQNRYTVERQIGEGGMGAVYVATDRRFGSTVALKETFFDEHNLRKAFEREARLLNRLRHAALPRVSDHFEEAEGQFLVMEYIGGADLGELLKARGGWFPLTDVLAWADELSEIKTICHTGKKATMTVRVDAGGHAMQAGPQVEIGGNDRYVSVSRAEFKKIMRGEGTIEPMQPSLLD